MIMKRLVPIALLLALVLTLAFAGTASAGKTVYWTSKDDIHWSPVSLPGYGHIVVPEPESTAYAGVKIQIYGPAYSVSASLDALPGIHNYSFWIEKPGPGTYIVIATVVSDTGRPLDSMRWRWVIG